MPSPPLAPLTPREQAVAELFRKPFRKRYVPDSCTLAVAAGLGLVARGFVSVYCLHSGDGTPFGPVAGSSAANFCTKAAPGWTWAAYTLTAVVLAGAVRWIARHRTFSRRLALAAVSLVAAAASVWLAVLPAVPPP